MENKNLFDDESYDSEDSFSDTSDIDVSEDIDDTDEYDSDVKQESKQDNKKEKTRKTIEIIILALLIVLILILVFSLFNRSYKVNLKNSDGTIIKTINVKANNVLEKPEEPKAPGEGYKFLGWYYKDKLFDFNTKIDKDIILVAKWEQVEGIKLEGKELDVYIDEEKQIDVKVFSPLTKDELIWSSSDPETIEVDDKGIVKALKEGKAVITVKSKDGKFVKTITVTSKIKGIDVTEIAIYGLNEVTIGQTIRLSAIITPEDATDKTVEWSSSNDKVATIDANGNVTGVSVGTVEITVTSADKKVTAKKTITVNPVVHVAEVYITGPDSVTEGQTITLSAGVNPSNAAEKSVKWSSSNNGIATVDQNGNVTGVKAGTVDILATSVDGGIVGRKTITVNPIIHVSSVSISGPTSVTEGQTIKLNASVNPSNAAEKGIKWSSNNNNIATVDQNGTVTGVSPGEVIITVTSVYGGKSATYKVVVNEKPATFVITFTPINTTVGVMQYTISVTRNGVAFTDYVWIEYGNNPGPYKQNVDSQKIDRSITTARITLNDGSTVTATVNYN